MLKEKIIAQLEEIKTTLESVNDYLKTQVVPPVTIISKVSYMVGVVEGMIFVLSKTKFGGKDGL